MRCIDGKFLFQNAIPASAKCRRKGCRPISAVLESDRARRMGEGSYSLSMGHGICGSTALNLPPLDSTLIRSQFSVSAQDHQVRFAAYRYVRAFRCARVCFLLTFICRRVTSDFGLGCNSFSRLKPRYSIIWALEVWYHEYAL